MGERGPLPKPHARRRNKRPKLGERRIDVARPSLPAGLAGEARAEWRRIVPQLEAAGLLAKLDRSVLIRYCTAWADWCELDEQLKATSKVIRGSKGQLIRNPLWIMRKEAEETLSDLGRQLGLSPNARIRVGVVHEQPVEEEPEAPGVSAIADYRKRLQA